MVRAQNDLYMVTACAGENSAHDNSAQGLAQGTVSRGDFQRCAKNICRFLLNSPALPRLLGQESPLDKELGEAPSFDEGEPAQLHYVAVDQEDRAHFDVGLIGLEKGQNTQFAVSIKKQGLYALKLVLRSTDSNLSPG